jgi:hypothetical protein
MKPTPEQVLATLFEQVELDKINQEVDAMTDEQIAKDLEAAGHTQAKIDAAFAPQQKMLDELLADERAQKRQQVLSYAGGLATAAAVALVVRSSTPSSPAVPTASPPATASPSRANDLRKEAFEACGRGHWADCTRLLDEAMKLDPDGESDPDVRQARSLAAHH